MRVFAALLGLMALRAQQPPNLIPANHKLARDIFKQLIEINTTDSAGDNTRAAEAMAARFREAGYAESDVRMLAPAPRKGNVVVRLRGTGRARPILFIGHLDVVEAKRSDWSFDPFEFRELDGYFYGRGASDMKGADATLVATFLRLKREGFQPSRDMILALTADEEGGNSNGIEWLVKNHRGLIDAEFCVNADGGGGDIRHGRRIYMAMAAAEKVYLSFKLEVTNPGGHSSRPVKDNAIYHLADGLSRLAKFEFPARLFDVTRVSFERMAPFYEGQLGADMKTIAQNPSDAAALARLSAVPQYNAQLRTTCVATMLSGGHAENALPQTATAIVNCRILPVDNAEDVQRTLNRVLADPKIKVTPLLPPKPIPFTPMNPKVLSAVTAATSKHWPGLGVIPNMDAGASDAVYLVGEGIPAYAVNGIFTDEDDDRNHGRDERILVQSFYEGVDFMYTLATILGKTD